MMMKHSLIAISLFGLWYGVCAIGAPLESKAEGDASSGAAGPATESAQTTESGEARTQSEPLAGGVEVNSDMDKVNYSLGYEAGRDLARDGLELVPKMLMKGAEDAVSGAKPLVKATERRAALAEIKTQREGENLERAQAFLAANAEKEGVKTRPSGLQYKEIRAGEGKTPGPGDSVTVSYRGTLIDGSEFDSSYKRGQPATFQVKRVIKGWAEALQQMKEGAKWELYIPPDLAYGKRGRDKRIPPNSALIFEVELISVDETPVRPPERTRPQGLPIPKPGADEK
jgi:FKBP-type peptidyl-prolyl cis-trans isomerase FklB